ncbi:hypothetical protein EVAR_41483_1 [Eumeta japonica]|uniref:Uncharacterized protein n=1 Tax=Eumeta variegata TaxID=151549 RepID=A0A4C1X3H9_EUMVA|nr:hypothetical protein EVAR_41483_1 [Eumeta japonica]
MESFMPISNDDPKFLQIHFTGSSEDCVSFRYLYDFIEQEEQKAIMELLDFYLENPNQFIPLFNKVAPQLINKNNQMVIKTDKIPLGERAGKFDGRP